MRRMEKILQNVLKLLQGIKKPTGRNKGSVPRKWYELKCGHKVEEV